MGKAFSDLLALRRDLAACQARVKEIEAKVIEFPSPPQSQVSVNANEVFNLLRPYGINLAGGASDWQYRLMTIEEANRFMMWYHQNAPIKLSDATPDDLDCDDFGWIMRAYALTWSEGKYLWGYMEAESVDPEWDFPMHGFDFVILDDKTVWFADQLGVAGMDNEVTEAYPVKCQMAKC